ncbi:MAG: hypothetical protein U0636_06805 [Phycisphaerales bacterium]
MRRRMYCIACGHNLAGVLSERCPECGHRFSLHNPSSYATSPKLLRRALTRYPAWKRHMLKRWTVMRCRTCGARVSETHPGRCDRCGHYYDPRQPEFAARALIFTPPFVVRLGQGSVFLGIVLPALLLTLAALTYTGVTAEWYRSVNDWLAGIPVPFPPSSGGALLQVQRHRVMAGVVLGGAIAMHFHFFWGQIEPFWRFAWLGVGLGLLIIAACIVAIPFLELRYWGWV